MGYSFTSVKIEMRFIGILRKTEKWSLKLVSETQHIKQILLIISNYQFTVFKCNTNESY